MARNFAGAAKWRQRLSPDLARLATEAQQEVPSRGRMDQVKPWIRW